MHGDGQQSYQPT